MPHNLLLVETIAKVSRRSGGPTLAPKRSGLSETKARGTESFILSSSPRHAMRSCQVIAHGLHGEATDCPDCESQQGQRSQRAPAPRIKRFLRQARRHKARHKHMLAVGI